MEKINYAKFAKELKSNGLTSDEIYKKLVSMASLFGKAFFGHKASKAERAKLRYLWKISL